MKNVIVHALGKQNSSLKKKILEGIGISELNLNFRSMQTAPLKGLNSKNKVLKINPIFFEKLLTKPNKNTFHNAYIQF